MHARKQAVVQSQRPRCCRGVAMDGVRLINRQVHAPKSDFTLVDEHFPDSIEEDIARMDALSAAGAKPGSNGMEPAMPQLDWFPERPKIDPDVGETDDKIGDDATSDSAA